MINVTFKKLLIILSIAVTLLIGILLGTSYAWYSFTNAVTPFSTETINENLSAAIIFTNDNNISTVVGVPINDDEAADKASKCLFTVTPKTDVLNGRRVAVQISLDDLSIDSALTSITDLKYSLLQTVDGTTTTIASGNFNGITSKSMILKPSYALTSGKTYSYEFRLWLHETNANQNSLMGKKINGVIKVSSAMK